MDIQLSDIADLCYIDRGDLDTALVQHPGLYFQVASQAAEATAEQDLAKDAIGTADASTELGFRTEAERSGAKLTEGRIKAMVQESDAHGAAFAAWVAARQASIQWIAARDALSTRGFVLRDLANMMVHDLINANSTTVSDRGPSRTEVAAADHAETKKTIARRRTRTRAPIES